MKKTALRRPVDCHKGNFGHAWILGGSRGMAGAGCLAAAAAMRSGAGKTTWATTRESYQAMGRAIPEVMSRTFPATAQGQWPASATSLLIKEASFSAQAIAIGPGLGRTPVTRRLVRTFLDRSTAPLILDADALWALEGESQLLRRARGPVIVTPHEGELRRLFRVVPPKGKTLRTSVAKAITNQYHCVLVWKGPDTLVAARGKKIFFNTTGNPGLAKGGSGDVLTGMIAGLAAQGFEPFHAAAVGVYAHGRAADLAAASTSVTSLAPSDLLKFLPAVWAELEKKRDLAGFLKLI